MKIVGITFLVLLCLVAIAGSIIFLIASRLPEQHTASRSVRLKQKPAAVYATVADFASANSWRSDIKRVEILGNVEGYLRFREDGSNGVVTYEVAENIPEKKIVTRIVDRDLGYYGSWTYSFEPADGGTNVRITEDGAVPNLFFRFMSRYVFGHTATIDTYITDLGKHFGENVVPED